MDIAAKRVYDDSAGRTRLAVGTGAGLAVVGISADVIGEFGLVVREPVRDLAVAGDERLLVATGDGVRVVDVGADDGGIADHDGVAEHGHPGDAAPVAVAVHDERAIVVDDAGTVSRAPLAAIGDTEADAGSGPESSSDPNAEPEWTTLGSASVRAADGGLLAASDGVYRIGDDGIDRVGLDDVRDVAAAGPLAATADGCYRLGPGWTRDMEGAFDVVTAAPDGRAHAAADGRLSERVDGADAAGTWTDAEWPAHAAVADLAYDAAATYAVATDGTVLADAGDGWRTRSIGLPDVTACAVVR